MKKTRPYSSPRRTPGPIATDVRYGEGSCSGALVDRARSMGPGVRRDDESKKPRSEPGPILIVTKPPRLLVGALLERGAENVAQRRPRIGGAVLRDGFLLLGDFQRLDRDLQDRKSVV